MLETGVILSGYRVDGVIGQGGMGVVYQATQLSLERTVALKVLDQRLSSDEAFRERFRREGVLQAAFEHPHIVTVYDTGESPHGLYLAMRLVRGGNLKDLILNRELDAQRTIRLLAQVADALDAAHEAGLVHRDIKPQNILVGTGDRAYLADFGLTKPVGTRGMTRTGEFMGSVDYMSPEQIRGRPPSQKSDIYAFASVLYEALTGAVPYPMDTDTAVLLAHVEEEPPAVSAQRPDLPAELDAVIARAMAKDPDERPASAAEFVRSAEEALGSAGSDIEPAAKAETKQALGIRPPPAPTRTSPPQAERVAEEVAPDREAVEEAPPQTKPKPPPARTRLSRPQTRVSKRAAPTRASTRPETRVSTDGAPPRAPVAARVAAILLAVAAIGGILGGIALGFRLDHGSSGSSSSASAKQGGVARTGALALRYPTGWAETQPRDVTGLRLRSPVALTGGEGDGETGLLAGFTNATGLTLLPTSFRQLLDGDPGKRERIRLGTLEGYRYPELGHEDLGDALRLYVVPTSSGVATIACFTEGPATALDECEGIAGTLRLKGAQAFAVSPDRDYARMLNSTLARASQARVSALARLQSAKTASAVASTIRKIPRAYRSAAQRLAAHEVSPEIKPTNEAIANALARVGSAYAGLGAAAASESDSRYAAQQQRVRAAERSLNRTLATLRALGYSVP